MTTEKMGLEDMLEEAIRFGKKLGQYGLIAVSYTHLTLPTKA